MGVFDTLKERGFVFLVSDEERLRAALDSGPVTAYAGYDPTASSLHVGHLLSIMMLKHLQLAGHRPIVVVGGGTGMIGDPTDKTEMRKLLTSDEIRANVEGLRPQFAQYLDFREGHPSAAVMVNNADWLLPLGYLEFLRDIGRRFTVNQLLQHSTYRERVEAGSLNFIEINYVLLQAYDFLHLHREYGCTLQVGGADQWFNILAGTELIRRVEGGEAFALVAPLIMTASGGKMGKTAAGSVWLDPDRTSPYEYYQYWINTADADVERFLALFTLLAMEDVRRLGRSQGADLREGKEVLAFHATALTYGEEVAERERARSRSFFRSRQRTREAFDAMEAERMEETFRQLEALGPGVHFFPLTRVPSDRLKAGVSLSDLLVEAGLASSKRAARDLIRQGGAYVNDERVQAVDAVVDENDLQNGAVLLRAGKKRYHRIEAE